MKKVKIKCFEIGSHVLQINVIYVRAMSMGFPNHGMVSRCVDRGVVWGVNVDVTSCVLS